MEDKNPPVVALPSQKENYSVKAFLHAYCITANVFYDEVRAGNLKIFKHRKRTYVTRADAELWLKKFSEQGENAPLWHSPKKKKEEPNPYRSS